MPTVWDGASEFGVDLTREIPAGFLDALESLLVLARNDGLGGPPAGGSERVPSRRVVRVSTNQTETRGPAKSGGRAGLACRPDPMRSMAAQRLLDRVNRRLRQLGREMNAFVHTAGDGVVRAGQRRCSRDKIFAEGDWLYCPRCGAQTEEID